MTYNLWDYRGESSEDNLREDDLRTVVDEAWPDILVVQEVNGTTGYTHFLEEVLNQEQSGAYEGAPFSDQTDTEMDIALYFRPDRFEVVSTKVINIASNPGYRDAVEFVIRHLPSDQVLRLYGVHLKAGNKDNDVSERESEASKLRAYLNTLPGNTHFVVLGDFNVYNGDEGGFQQFVESKNDNDGRVADPINRIGPWNNNSAYADVHTQSSRASYGGRNYGGMDDRFDFILTSTAILAATEVNYVTGSYVALGNDGNHFNRAINDGYNSVVSSQVADALVEASDHIPVYLELEFIGAGTSPHRIVINEIMQNPNVVTDSYGEWFELFNAGSVSVDLCGWMVKDRDQDAFTITCDGKLEIPSGGYFVFAANGNSAANGGLSPDYVYHYSDFMLSNNDDEIILLDKDGGEVDRVQYDGGKSFPDPTGASMALLDPSADNNLGTNWTISTRSYGAGDKGTPGEANHDVAVEEEIPLIKAFRLHQNYPNPFNGNTRIRFDLAEDAYVRLTIYNLRGREVTTLANGPVLAGTHTLTWRSDGQPAGLYLYSLETENLKQTRKLVLLK